MGWRDINMSRRRPQPRRAFVPVEEGMDRAQAVIAKAAAQAVSAMAEQIGEGQGGDHSDLAAGYVLGFARQMAARDGVSDMADDALVAALSEHTELGDLTTLACQAGRLIGRLEALCESRRLLRQACEKLKTGGPDAGAAFLTDCDIAADPMQTRMPTTPLRFTTEERAVILAGFNP